MSTRRSTWLAWSLCALTLALTALGLLLLALSLTVPVRLGFGFRGAAALFALTFSLVGTLIATRQPANAVGWICCVVGLSFGLQVFAEQYAIYALFAHPGTLPAGVYLAWIRDWIWFPAVGLTGTFLLLLFPTGHLPSARWRPVAWLAVPAIVVPILVRPFLPGDLENLPVANPLGLPGMRGIPELIGNGAFILLSALAFASATSLVLRFRRAGGIERQQIKWLAYAAVFLAIALTASALSPFETLAYLVIVTLLSVPIAVGVAILRYRLYDIDVLINRTLVYGALTATLGLIYIGCIVLSRTLIAPLTGGSELAIVASTLVIAALFNPLRKRIQQLIDKRFYRRKYDAAKVLAAFGATVRDETELERLTAELLRVVDDTMQPEFVGLWLRETSARSTPEEARPNSLSLR